LWGAGKSGILTASRGNSTGLRFAGPGGPAFIPGSLFVSVDLGQSIPQILLFVSADLIQPIPIMDNNGLLVSTGKPIIIDVGYCYQPTPILTPGILINHFFSSGGY
jgi:hypothetical protein